MNISQKVAVGGFIIMSLAFLITFGHDIFYLGGLNTEVEELKDDCHIREIKKLLKIETENSIQQIKSSIKGWCPIGSIIAYSGKVDSHEDLPPGWMLCNGDIIPDAPEYKEIKKLLNNTNWAKNEDKICLPDLRRHVS